jgi:hypothetical protein
MSSPSNNSVLRARPRPARRGTGGGRAYIGPKAQSSVHESFFERTMVEAVDRKCPLTDVWREVIYAGLLRTGRATRAEIAEACALVGIDFAALDRVA